MLITVTGRRLAVSEALKEQIQKRVRRLERVLDGRALSAQCVLSVERQRHTCELTVRVAGGRPLVGLGRDGQARTALAMAVDKVAHQAVRLTGRRVSRRRADSGSPGRRRIGRERPAGTRAGESD